VVVELLRRSRLLQLSIAHDADAVGEPQRFRLIVCDHHCRHVVLAEHVMDLPSRVLESGRGREKNVHQDDCGAAPSPARQRHALLLSSRELAREPARMLRQLCARKDIHGAAAPFLGTQSPQPEGHVLDHREVRKEREILEYEADLAMLGGHECNSVSAQHAATEGNLSAARALETGDRAQRRRLSGAGGSQQRKDLALLELERHAVDGVTSLAPVSQMEILDCEQRHQ
jgi:hypothetical protein